MTAYEDDQVRRYFKDKSFEADYKWLAGKFPGKEIGVASRTNDEQIVAGDRALGHRARRQLPVRPQETHADAPIQDPGKAAARIAGVHAAGALQIVRWPGDSGLSDFAEGRAGEGSCRRWLCRTAVPWARDEWGYNPLAQFFANRGYAVLMPNFRGSTGFGKKFLNAGNGEWGRKMQDDITWGVKYLVAEGIADPKRIGILGGSYGGYATLGRCCFYAGSVSRGRGYRGSVESASRCSNPFRRIGKPAAK